MQSIGLRLRSQMKEAKKQDSKTQASGPSKGARQRRKKFGR